MAAKYKYYIDFGSGETEFIPDQDAQYTWKKENEYAAFMRKAVDELVISRDYDDEGTLINSSVFDTLWEWYFDSTKHQTEITFKVYKNGAEDYEGTFYILDGDIDVNDGIYTISATPNDSYREFLLYVENEINIIDSGGDYTAILDYVPTLESGTGTETTPPPNDSAVSDELWNATWIRDPAVGSTTWWRLKSAYEIFSGQGIFISGFYYYPDLTTSGYETTFDFPNCFKLTERIQYLLDTMLTDSSLSLTFVSNFFNEPYDNFYATNYVTGRKNHLINTLLEHNTDAKDPDATNKATIGRISFNQLMADLNAMYNVKWYIDGSNLRIEHQKFFDLGLRTSGLKKVCIDLTDETKYIADEIFNLYILDGQKFERFENAKSKREVIAFQDPETNDFRDDLNHIDYDVLVTEKATKINSVSQFSTDVAKLINNTDNVLDDGFYLFNIDDGKEYPGSDPLPEEGDIIEIREIYTTDEYGVVANAGFSAKWLLYDYYKHGRQDFSGTLTVEGNIEYDTYEVLSAKPLFIQKDIVFLLNDNDTIDINQYIRTYLIKSDGVKYKVDGEIISISHDLNTDFVTATLGFEI